MTRSFLLFVSLSAAALTLNSRLTYAKELVVFDCKSSHSMFDPNYEQGSEIYLQVKFDRQTNLVSIEFEPAAGPAYYLYPGQSNTNATYRQQSSVTLDWSNANWQASVVMYYLGGSWDFYSKVPEEIDANQRNFWLFKQDKRLNSRSVIFGPFCLFNAAYVITKPTLVE